MPARDRRLRTASPPFHEGDTRSKRIDAKVLHAMRTLLHVPALIAHYTVGTALVLGHFVIVGIQLHRAVG